MSGSDNGPERESATVLVTGWDGLLGSEVVRALESAGTTVRRFEGDVREPVSLDPEIDAVCHLAGITKLGDGVTREDMFEVNVEGTRRMAAACAETGARLVMASSSAVYKPTDPEELLTEDSETGPVLEYGESKLAAEAAAAEFAERGAAVSCLRVFNLYGPGQDTSFIVPMIVSGLLSGAIVDIREPGKVRDFVFVRDVAMAFSCALAYPQQGFNVYNIGSGAGISIAGLAAMAVDATHSSPALLKFHGGTVEDAVVADVNKAIEELVWLPEVLLEQGLEEMAATPTGRVTEA